MHARSAIDTTGCSDEQPVSSHVLDEAIAWQLLLDAGQASEAQQMHLKRWLDAHTDHARVWRQLGMLDAGLHALPRKRTAPLRKLLLKSRRTPSWKPVVGTLGVVLAVALGALAVDRIQPIRGGLADYRTGTGEQRRVVLPDQTVIVLNTRSAVDLEFDAERRAIRLRAGEVHIHTSHANPDERRPFVVLTAEGSLRALGTRFIVRQADAGTDLTVIESAVLARPQHCSVAPDAACIDERLVTANHSLRLAADGVGNILPARPEADAWKDGMLVVENMALEEVVAELARHRSGVLSVAPEIAQLRVTGTVPLNDIDYALRALTQSLPVRLVRYGRLWVHIEERERK